MRLKQHLALIGFLGLLVCGVYAPRFSAQGIPMLITAAGPNSSRTVLFVSGRNFPPDATVSLAESALSGVTVDATGTSITAELPATISPGSYLLRVTDAGDSTATATFIVTLGDTHDLGDDNTGVGGRALMSLATGASNTALGAHALESVSASSGNIAVGSMAGSKLITGGNDIYIGHPGVDGDTNIIRIGDGTTHTDTYLTGVIHGDGSGLTGVVRPDAATGSVGIGTTTPAFRLDVVGSNTMADRTIGINGTPMIYFPDQAPFFSSMALGNGLRNLSHGASEQGRYNTAVGIDALLANTTGYFNTAVGALAMSNNTTGVYSVAIGQGALFSNTTGVNNTAVGVSALYSNTTANYNTAIGLDALEFNTTGTENTAVGKRSNWQNATGSFNTSLGTDSLFWNLTGTANTALGHNALNANTASNNVAVGAAAMQNNTTGAENAAFGRAALFNSDAGSFNTAIGNLAGRYQADGATGLTAASQSVYVGYAAMGLDNRDSNSIVIGAYAKGIGADSVVLGNDNVATTALKGRVGIRTTRPALTLNVVGHTGYPATSGSSPTGIVRLEGENDNVLDIGQANGGAYGLWLQGTNRQNLALSYPLLLNPTGGNVGIGTTAPASTLEVNGAVDARAFKVDGGAGATCSGAPTANFRVVNGIVTGC